MAGTFVGIEKHARDVARRHDVQVAARCVRVQVGVGSGHPRAVALRHLPAPRDCTIKMSKVQIGA